MNHIEGHLLTPNGFLSGSMDIDQEGRIALVTGTPVPEDQVRQSRTPILLPGCIDLHVHGGADHDIMEGGEAAFHVARFHARHGTPAMAATTMTARAPKADKKAAPAAAATFLKPITAALPSKTRGK